VIVGVGIDVVPVERFADSLRRTPSLAGRLFTAAEQVTASGEPRTAESLAARFAAGELKHGPIALIEQDLPVVVVVPSPKRPLLHDKIVSNIQEIRARGAKTIVIAEDGDDVVAPYADFLFHVPELPILLQPLVATVPLQVFAAELADALGYDVDQPRNLAKSVTVE